MLSLVINEVGMNKPDDQAEAITLRCRILEGVAMHGSLRKLADHIGVDVAYLSRLKKGDKINPGAEILDKLNLKRHEFVFYTRSNP
jgi:transcriptional regulator with XRE-family HTH domain